MPERELNTKLIKHGDELVIPITNEFIDGTLLTEGMDLVIAQTKKNTFEIRLPKLEGEVNCQICNKSTGKYTCSICGTIACPTCFWELGGLCNKCAKR